MAPILMFVMDASIANGGFIDVNVRFPVICSRIGAVNGRKLLTNERFPVMNGANRVVIVRIRTIVMDVSITHSGSVLIYVDGQAVGGGEGDAHPADPGVGGPNRRVRAAGVAEGDVESGAQCVAAPEFILAAATSVEGSHRLAGTSQLDPDEAREVLERANDLEAVALVTEQFLIGLRHTIAVQRAKIGEDALQTYAVAKASGRTRPRGTSAASSNPCAGPSMTAPASGPSRGGGLYGSKSSFEVLTEEIPPHYC